MLANANQQVVLPVATMRFQVQWSGNNGKGEFSEVVNNDWNIGVTKSQALDVLEKLLLQVEPRKVRESWHLADAMERAKRFIRQANGMQPGLPKSIRLALDNPTGAMNARIDIENKRGPNNLTSW